MVAADTGTKGLEYLFPRSSGRMQLVKNASDFFTQSLQNASSGNTRSMCSEG